MTSTLSAPPIDVKRGFVAYVLAHGHRLGGRKVQFFDADDANNPATAIQQVQKLVNEDGVDVIEGIFFSGVLLGVRDTIDQLKVPTVVANAAANALSRDRKSDYIYRTSYSNYQLGVPLGPWAARTIGKSGVAAITANYAAGQESAAAFKQAYEQAGGTLATTMEYGPVQLWHVPSGQSRAVLRGHATRVECLTFDPAGTRLASVSQDGVVKIWDLSPPRS